MCCGLDLLVLFKVGCVGCVQFGCLVLLLTWLFLFNSVVLVVIY